MTTESPRVRCPERRRRRVHRGARQPLARVRHDVPAHERLAAQLADQRAVVERDEVRDRVPAPGGGAGGEGEATVGLGRGDARVVSSLGGRRRPRVVVVDPREYLRRAMLRVRRSVLGGPVEQPEAASREDARALVAGARAPPPVGAEHQARPRAIDELPQVIDELVFRDAGAT